MLYRVELWSITAGVFLTTKLNQLPPFILKSLCQYLALSIRPMVVGAVYLSNFFRKPLQQKSLYSVSMNGLPDVIVFLMINWMCQSLTDIRAVRGVFNFQAVDLENFHLIQTRSKKLLLNNNNNVYLIKHPY